MNSGSDAVSVELSGYSKLNQGTKQRIVGTVVLLALALIFLPFIFDGQGSYQDTISSRIPDPPAVPVLSEPVQSRPVIIADTELVSEAEPAEPEIEDSVSVTTSEPAFTREPPSFGDNGLPVGWSVRLGSFSDSSNAANLLQCLQAAGYKAYTRVISSAQGTLTGVFVGPWIDRARVDDYQQRLQDEFQLAGDVVRYEIEQL